MSELNLVPSIGCFGQAEFFNSVNKRAVDRIPKKGDLGSQPPNCHCTSLQRSGQSQDILSCLSRAWQGRI